MTNTGAVAKTILQQLGGGSLWAMLDAFALVVDTNGMQFKFMARAKNGANCIRVHLDPSDTYRVEFWSVRGRTGDAKQVSAFDDVFAEDLRRIFEAETGLRVSL